jgi:hypothetical protein
VGLAPLSPFAGFSGALQGAIFRAFKAFLKAFQAQFLSKI